MKKEKNFQKMTLLELKNRRCLMKYLSLIIITDFKKFLTVKL